MPSQINTPIISQGQHSEVSVLAGGTASTPVFIGGTQWTAWAQREIGSEAYSNGCAEQQSLWS